MAKDKKYLKNNKYGKHKKIPIDKYKVKPPSAPIIPIIKKPLPSKSNWPHNWTEESISKAHDFWLPTLLGTSDTEINTHWLPAPEPSLDDQQTVPSSLVNPPIQIETIHNEIIEDSFEHAVDDFNQRQLIEFRQSAERIFLGIEQTWDVAENTLSKLECTKILKQIDAVRQSMKGQDSQELKLQLDMLGDLTRPLADNAMGRSILSELKDGVQLNG